MPTGRAAHSAVSLPDGRVLLIGGCVRESCEAGPESATVVAYDSATRGFRPAGTLTARRISPASALLASGEVLIAGGWVGSTVTGAVEIFNPATGTSRRVTPLAVARSDISMVLLADGRIIIAGGFDGARPVAIVEVFDPRGFTVSKAGNLAVARAGAGGARLADGQLVFVGGGTGAGNRPTDTAEVYDPRTQRSSPTGAMAEARYKHAVVALSDGRVLAFGGSDHRDRGGKLATVESFDPATRQFTSAGRLREPRYKIGGAVQLLPDGRVLVAGGAPRAEIYDPKTRLTVYTGPSFGKSLNFATVSLLRDGTLVAGGYDENGIRLNRQAWVMRPE